MQNPLEKSFWFQHITAEDCWRWSGKLLCYSRWLLPFASWWWQ